MPHEFDAARAKIPCPFCEKKVKQMGLYSHITSKHADLVRLAIAGVFHPKAKAPLKITIEATGVHLSTAEECA